MTPFWMLRGYLSEGRGIVRAALALPAVQASDLAQAHAAYAGAVLATAQGDHAEARQMLEKCLVLYRRLGNQIEVAATLSMLTLARLQAGDAAGAEASEREALALFRALGEKEGEVVGLLHLGQIAVYVGNAELAQSSLEECLRIARAIEDREAEGEAELRLGENAFEDGRADDARRHVERSLAVCRDAGDRRGEAHAQYWLGKMDLQAADLDRARRRLGEALLAFREVEMREELADCLEDHAELAHCQGHAQAAVRLAAAASAFRARLAIARSPRAERRWQAIQWVHFQMGGIGPMFGQVGFFHFFAGKEYEDKRPRDRYVAEAARLLAVLDARLEGRAWVMGDAYTVADIAILPWVNNLVTRYGAGDLVGWPRYTQVARVLDAFKARPAVQRGLKVPAAPQ